MRYSFQISISERSFILKRKENARYWTDQISKYRESGESLIRWCADHDIKIHTMKYWLRKQAPVSPYPETAWVSCVVEEPAPDSITLKLKGVEIEVMSGFPDALLLRVLRTLDQL